MTGRYGIPGHRLRAWHALVLVLRSWDQDATAAADRYGEQDPAEVAGDLATAADVIAAHFDSLARGSMAAGRQPQ